MNANNKTVFNFSLPLVLFASQVFAQECGVERWPVKTGSDADARLVNLNSTTASTISSLAGLTKPSNLPQNNRVQPTETTVFVVNATLTEYKRESDSDYHVVLSDSTGKTLIVEIPWPGCVDASSPFAAAIRNARAQFDARLSATTDFKRDSIPVQIKGVGFFDFLHGQTGAALNGIELHPVLDILFNPTSTPSTPTVTSVDTAGGFAEIAQNSWIVVKGNNLAPASPVSGVTWSDAPEFASGKMPTQLNNVSVKVNGKPGYVYYVSPTQINVLTPLDSAQGSTQVVVTNGAVSATPFTVTRRSVAPSFLLFGATNYIAATHANGALLGPMSLSVPGYPFTPAQPGETIVLYATGFGLPTTTLVDGSATQFGSLPTAPNIQIGGASAKVEFAGVIGPGLYQFNVVVPDTTAASDAMVTATYGGFSSPPIAAIPVQR